MFADLRRLGVPFPLFGAFMLSITECAEFTPSDKPKGFGKLRALAKSVIFARADNFFKKSEKRVSSLFLSVKNL